jgi:hypothetical protein
MPLTWFTWVFSNIFIVWFLANAGFPFSATETDSHGRQSLELCWKVRASGKVNDCLFFVSSDADWNRTETKHIAAWTRILLCKVEKVEFQRNDHGMDSRRNATRIKLDLGEKCPLFKLIQLPDMKSSRNETFGDDPSQGMLSQYLFIGSAQRWNRYSFGFEIVSRTNWDDMNSSIEAYMGLSVPNLILCTVPDVFWIIYHRFLIGPSFQSLSSFVGSAAEVSH